MNFRRIACSTTVFCAALCNTPILGQQGGSASMTTSVQEKGKEVSVTITEPGVYSLAQLYKTADVVALVKITAADEESYPKAVYKSTVVTAFKGSKEGQVVYFGPFIGEKLGSEYFVFLKNEKQPLAPTKESKVAFGVVPYAIDFDDGFTEMESHYQCAFSGKEIKDQCDDGVRVCTDFIRLPKRTKVSEDEEPGTSGCRWVRKRVFLSLLASQ